MRLGKLEISAITVKRKFSSLYARPFDVRLAQNSL